MAEVALAEPQGCQPLSRAQEQLKSVVNGDSVGGDGEAHDPSSVGFSTLREAKGTGGVSEVSDDRESILVWTLRFRL